MAIDTRNWPKLIYRFLFGFDNIKLFPHNWMNVMMMWQGNNRSKNKIPMQTQWCSLSSWSSLMNIHFSFIIFTFHPLWMNILLMFLTMCHIQITNILWYCCHHRLMLSNETSLTKSFGLSLKIEFMLPM